MHEPKSLPGLRVMLQRVPPGERAVPLDYPENPGLPTKIGGEPEWIQPNDDTPICPRCRDRMTFVAQIDSVEHDSEHNPLRRPCTGQQDYMFGDVGMIYVFFCFSCCEPASVHQGY